MDANKISNHTTKSRRQKRVLSTLYYIKLKCYSRNKMQYFIYDGSMAELWRNTAQVWSTYGPSTLLIIWNVTKWEKYGSPITRGRQDGWVCLIPSPRGQGTSPVKWLVGSSICTSDKIVCPYLSFFCSILFHLWNSSLEFLTAVWNFRLFLPSLRKVNDVAKMKWWCIFHFEMQMFPLSWEGGGIRDSGGIQFITSFE